MTEDWVAFAKRQNEKATKARWWSTLSQVAMALIIVSLVIWVSDNSTVRLEDAPFSYVGERNEYGIVEYMPESPVYCIGDSVNYSINVDVNRPFGHASVKQAIVTQSGGAIVRPSETSDRIIPIIVSYTDIPRVIPTEGLPQKFLYIATSARTNSTTEQMYVVPFAVLDCNHDRKFIHQH